MRPTTLSMRSSKKRPTARSPRNPGDYSMLESPKHWRVGSPSVSHMEPELLAYHYEQAGLAGPAVEYWHRAARRDAERSANIEALNHFNRALDVAQGSAARPGAECLGVGAPPRTRSPLAVRKRLCIRRNGTQLSKGEGVVTGEQRFRASVSRHLGIMGISSGQRATRQCSRPSRKSPRSGYTASKARIY